VKRSYLLFLGFVLSCLSDGSWCESASARIFTSTDGKKLEGEVIKVQDKEVVIKVGTQNFTVPKDRFIQDDQTYFVAWAKKAAAERIPKVDVHVSSGVNRKDKGSYWKHIDESVDFKVKIESRENQYNIAKAKGTLVVFAENCEDGDEYKVIQKTSINIDIEARQTFIWQAKEVKYDYYDDSDYRKGFKYYGYVLQLKNSAGKVFFSKAMPKKFEAVVNEAIKLKNNAQVDRTMAKL